MIARTHPTNEQALSQAELSDLIALQHEVPQTSPRGSFLPSPEQVQREIARMTETELSPNFSQWVDGYARVGRRNPYLWKWCRQAVALTTLPCVRPELREELCDTKTLGVMWDVMLDDVADRNGKGDLLDELLTLVDGRTGPDFSRFSPEEQTYAGFTADLWNEIMTRARRYPRYEEFAALLRFDYRQLANVMRYSHLLNGNLHLLNLVEHDVYTPHNMHIMICSTLDLMCSPAFDRREVGRLREVVWHAQWMGRIGNLVTTWERELGEGDFTSGVYARAVVRGDVTVEQLLAGDQLAIRAAIETGGHEAWFLERWRRHRRFLLSRRARLRSFNVREYLAGFERLICLHLGSRGNK
jgi:hypothetical protein